MLGADWQLNPFWGHKKNQAHTSRWKCTHESVCRIQSVFIWYYTTLKVGLYLHSQQVHLPCVTTTFTTSCETPQQPQQGAQVYHNNPSQQVHNGVLRSTDNWPTTTADLHNMLWTCCEGCSGLPQHVVSSQDMLREQEWLQLIKHVVGCCRRLLWVDLSTLLWSEYSLLWICCECRHKPTFRLDGTLQTHAWSYIWETPQTVKISNMVQLGQPGAATVGLVKSCPKAHVLFHKHIVCLYM